MREKLEVCRGGKAAAGYVEKDRKSQGQVGGR